VLGAFRRAAFERLRRWGARPRGDWPSLAPHDRLDRGRLRTEWSFVRTGSVSVARRRDVRVLCGTDRPRPCATDRWHDRRSPISRTVAHRRAPSVHARLRMAFKRSWVRLPSAPFISLVLGF